MADNGKSIADAYRNWNADSATAAPSEGASIADAYRTQTAGAPPPAKSWRDDYPASDPGDIVPPTAVTAAIGRVGQAVAEGWQGGTMQTPAAYAGNQETWVGRNVVNPLVEAGNIPLRALGALGRGGMQAIYEVGEPLGRAMPEIRIPNITLPSDNSITYPGGITIDRPGRGFGGTVLGGPGLGRDLNLLSQVAPVAGDMRAPMRAPWDVPPGPSSPQLVSERLAPPRPPGMTDAERIQQLVEHAVNEEQPAVGPPMARGPLTQEQAPTGGGPQRGVGAVPPADNALVTPSISPTAAPSARIAPIVTQAQAEAEADRILRHFAGDQPVVINSTPLASGAQPTLSQSVEGGHGGLAGLERGVRDVPEQTQHFVARETGNTALRNKAVGEVIGDSRATDVVEAELNNRTRPQEKAIFDPARTKPVDTSDAIATLDQILNGPQGQRDVVRSSLQQLRDKLIDKNGKMQTDAAQLRGVDLSIGDQISPKAAGTAHDGRAAAHELMAVRDVLRDTMEQGAPGYKDWLAQQAAERSAIDGQRFLQARNITDRQGNVNLGTLDATIKAAERQQAMPGARLADGVTDAQLDTLRKLRADYQNDAKQRLGTSLGSPTVQKLGVSGSMGVMGHPLLAGAVGTGGALAAGVNPLLGTALGVASYALKQQSLKAQRMVMDALRDKLLNPEKARSAFTPR